MERSSRPERIPVKPGGAGDRERRGIARHFEGWQPGLLALFLAGSSAVLAVPRSVDPHELPEPVVEPRALDRLALADERLARAAERAALDFDVRALGSAVRAYGVADDAGSGSALEVERKRVAQASARARPHGDQALLELRAWQLRSFLRELARWEATGEETDELRELGGGFIHMVKRTGWVDEDGRRLRMDAAVRAALFKKRWNELAVLRGAPFELALDESRALFRFLLRNPPREDPPGPRDAQKDAALRIALAAEQYRLRKIDELGALDPTFPAQLGRGVVFYRLHRYPLAVEAFRRHLEDHPEGPFTLRAQNYLRAALGRATEDP